MLFSYPAISQLAIYFSAVSQPAISFVPPFMHPLSTIHLSLHAIVFLLIAIFFAIILLILLAPFGFSLNLGKKENLVWGSIRLTWLCLTLIKREVSTQSIDELLASIGREMDEMDEKAGTKGKEGNDGNGEDEKQDAGEPRAGAKENATKRLFRRWREKSIGRDEKYPEEKLQEEREAENLSTAGENIIDGMTDGRVAKKTEASGKARVSRRSPSIRSLIDAAPALAEFLGDLGRSIRIIRFSCRLCFGLNDPAQTAIISGYIWFFASLLGVSLADLTLEPWFDGLRLEGKLDAEIRARLISPIWAAVKSLRRKEIRKLVREILGWS